MAETAEKPETDVDDTGPENPQPEVVFPVDSLEEALPHFRRPFMPDALKFKGQSASGQDNVLVVGYVDVRLVIERLNMVVGAEWEDTYEAASKGLWCHLNVYGVTRHDIGDGSFPKAQVSDALKRAAVKFGVGVPIYAIPRMTAPHTGENPPVARWKTGDKNGRPTYAYRIEPHGIVRAREIYAEWLAERGIAAFGEPLDHGDAPEASGVEDDEAPEGAQQALDVAPLPVRLVDAEADRLRGEIRAMYGSLPPKAKRPLPPQRFRERLEVASESHEALTALLDEIKALDETKAMAEEKEATPA